MKKKNVLIVTISIMIVIILLTIGYSAFSKQLAVSSAKAHIMAQKDVRITNVTATTTNGAIASPDFTHRTISSALRMPQNSTVTYNVTVTTFGNQPMAIYAIDTSGLPSNLQINSNIVGYTLKDKICETSNPSKCTLNASRKFSITIEYANYDPNNTNYSSSLVFEFVPVYNVTYSNMTNNSYPSTAYGGKPFEVTFTGDIPYDIVLNKNFPFTYANNKLTVTNINDDFNINRYYGITYNLDGGTQASNQPIKYLPGQTVNILDPTKTDYTFQGWFDNAGFTGNAITSTSGKSGNLVLYAKWKSNQPSAIPITDLVEGDHIIYVDANGDERECVILYDSTSSYGIQAITTDIVGNFSIGNGTSSQSGVNRTNSTTSAINKYNTARNSYNDARSDLNEAARAYVNTDLSPANGARIVGTPPDNPDIVNSEHYHSSYTYANNSGLPGTDDYYQTDLNQMKKSNINAAEISSHYWMGSYYVGSGSSTTSFYVRVVRADDDNVTNNINGSYMNRIFTINKTLSNSNSYGGMSHGVRPVFTLRNDLYVSAGNNGIYTFVTQ